MIAADGKPPLSQLFSFAGVPRSLFETSRECEELAANWMALAETAAKPDLREKYLRLARSWQRLALQHELLDHALKNANR
jgi:hypothetical protein